VTGRRIVRVDSLFEAALGLVLVAGALTGRLDGADFPAPVGTPLIAVLGCALVAVGLILWLLARRPVPARLLRALAGANLATAVAAVAWVLLAPGFSTGGAALTLAVAVCLAALATVQFSVAARERGASALVVQPPPSG